MTDKITQNDCQGEDDYMAFYTKLSPLEKQLFKAIGIPFQLQDFGHNVLEEDGEYFEQTSEQTGRFTDANKIALSKVMSIVRAEIARLQAELNEAREIINNAHNWFDVYSQAMAQGLFLPGLSTPAPSSPRERQIMDKKKTWEERIVDSIISLFFFGLMVTAFDLIGIRLDWAGGIALSIVALLAFVITALIGGIVYAIRMRRKTDG